jgi:quercetin dioxygenase-like cupin family protein
MDSLRHERHGDELRDYYDSTHFRIVVTHLPPGHVQNEHRHERLYDITWVIDGEIEISERTTDGPSSAVLHAGDLAVCEPGPLHNVANRSAMPATTLTLKIVRPADLSRAEFAELCRVDWYPATGEKG